MPEARLAAYDGTLRRQSVIHDNEVGDLSNGDLAAVGYPKRTQLVVACRLYRLL